LAGPVDRVRNASGLTLIEVLIASVLVLLLVTEIAGFFARGRMAMVEEGRKRTALGLATAELERLEGQELSAMQPANDRLTVAGWRYDRTTRIDRDTPAPGLSRATTVVTWLTRAGKSRRVTLEAAYAPPR
jgi:Tfp pilus assembly protein PilV